MRQNKPTLVDPNNTVTRQTDQTLGIPTLHSLDLRLSAVERAMSLLTQRLDAVPPSQTFTNMEALLGVLEFIVPGLVWNKGIKGSVTPTSVTGTSAVTIVSASLGPLAKGVQYLVLALAANASNADPAGFIYACSRIEAAGTTDDGMQTGTASGERTLMSFSGKLVVGTGVTITNSSRARLSAAGSGSVNDAAILTLGIPTGYPILT